MIASTVLRKRGSGVCFPDWTSEMSKSERAIPTDEPPGVRGHTPSDFEHCTVSRGGCGGPLPGLPPPVPPLRALGMHDDRGGRFSSGQGEVRRERDALSALANRIGEWVGIGDGTRGGWWTGASSAPAGAGRAESRCPRVALRPGGRGLREADQGREPRRPHGKPALDLNGGRPVEDLSTAETCFSVRLGALAFSKNGEAPPPLLASEST